MCEVNGHRRDVKEDDRMNGKQETPPQRRCWDWMIVCGDCHYARDRSAFKTYRHVGKTVTGNGLIPNQNIFVAGIGTVELRVSTDNEEGSPDGVLVLENVLHLPSAICNGFNCVKYHNIIGGSSRLGRDTKGFDGDGRIIWRGQPFIGLQKLVLAGNPRGDSSLRESEGVMHSLSVYISNEDLRTVMA